jgi:hypothetical protein
VRALSAQSSLGAKYYIAVVGENNGGTIGTVYFNTLPAYYNATVPNPIYSYGAKASTPIVSEAITPTDFNVPIRIEFGSSPYPGVAPMVSVDGGAWNAEATIRPGQTFRLKLDVPQDAFDSGGSMLSVIYSAGTRSGLAWFIQK